MCGVEGLSLRVKRLGIATCPAVRGAAGVVHGYVECPGAWVSGVAYGIENLSLRVQNFEIGDQGSGFRIRRRSRSLV